MQKPQQEDSLNHYRQSGPLSRLPAEIRAERLPDDPGSLVKLVQGLLTHAFWAERYGISLAPAWIPINK